MHKFFTEKDYVDEERLYDIKLKGLFDHIKDEKSENEAYPEYVRYEFKDRYGSLRQDTVFFRNLCRIHNIFHNSVSYSDFILKCEVSGISERHVNFMLLYYRFCPGRIFSYDFWEWSAEDIKKRVNDSYTANLYGEWVKFKQMLYDAFHGKKHNCSTYIEFVEKEL